MGFPVSLAVAVKNLPANAGDIGLTSALGKSHGEGNGSPFPYSSLGNPMDRGPGRLQSMRSGVRHDLATQQQQPVLIDSLFAFNIKYSRFMLCFSYSDWELALFLKSCIFFLRSSGSLYCETVFRNHTQATSSVHSYSAVTVSGFGVDRKHSFLKCSMTSSELTIQILLNLISLTKTSILIPAPPITWRTSNRICDDS